MDRVIRFAVFPIIFYFFIFSLFTYPLVSLFSTHLFADEGDGLVHVWNIWWVNKALTELHQSPWQTHYLHYPYGISLLGHTLNPFNGFMGIILMKFLTLVETYNFIVIFSFLMTGLTAFWLSYYFTRSYWAGIIGGFIFTFSNYHFAHAEGHLNLVSLEWLPLFALCWHRAVTKPSIIIAFISGVLLFLIFLCDYYYFLYGILAGALIVVWWIRKNKDIFFFLKRKHLIPFFVFIAFVLTTTGPLLISLFILDKRDPLWGYHPPVINSLDILAPFIYGGHWRLSHITEFYWSKLPGNIHENSVHMGLSVIGLIVYVWLKRHKSGVQGLGLWYFILLFFAIMSLGPILQICGKEFSYVRLPYALLKKALPAFRLSYYVRAAIAILTGILCFLAFYIMMRRRKRQFHSLWFWYLMLIFFGITSFEVLLHIRGSGVLFIRLPYALLENILPPLKLSGNPVRMMAMVMLAASVISAAGFKVLFQKPSGRRFAIILLILILFEYLPKPMPASLPNIPQYIRFLKDLPDASVIDIVSPAMHALYYQTIHEKPMAFGEISRIPKTLYEENKKLLQLVEDREYVKLYRDYEIGYVVTNSTLNHPGAEMLYNEGRVKIYRLGRE